MLLVQLRRQRAGCGPVWHQFAELTATDSQKAFSNPELAVPRIVDGFFIPAAQRLGDLGAAWRRLLTAVRAERGRWRG
jgi:hypothetical protein